MQLKYRFFKQDLQKFKQTRHVKIIRKSFRFKGIEIKKEKIRVVF